ncbi:MAG: exodeoxyribonuclease VII large subunit [Desulfovibrionaceae bacterium]|jgi:exodeoxyribonuclease VII large subunit|nr:exodeoxyribonuclease VII large subunit [Desulfovibrionaceae bacterium]
MGQGVADGLRVRSVREVTSAIKAVLEGEFPFLWVRGQVTNLSRPGSGHLYFTLKDEEAALNVVWFRGSQRAAPNLPDPLTGEVADPDEGPDAGGGFGAVRVASLAAALRDGQEVLCAGRINVYPPRGQYQLVAEVVQDVGVGRLYAEFERLKRELAARGFFAAERKRPLPYHPARVAVVTAPTGAAVRDFVRIASERGWGASLRIYPALVQGDAAPAQIARALARAGADGWAQCVALIRGGGSLEDLWAFNTLEVAEAVHGSVLPVIAGVGHEVDHTIADMVADVRAATPSHAAQLLWPEREQVAQRIDGLETALRAAWNGACRELERELSGLERALAWLSPLQALRRVDERLTDGARALAAAMERFLARREDAVRAADESLARRFGPEFFALRAVPLDDLDGRVRRAGAALVASADGALERLELRLAGLDPEAPLARGYAMVRSRRTGAFLRSVCDARPGDALDIRVADGAVPAVVAGPDGAAGAGGVSGGPTGARRSAPRRKRAGSGPQQGSLLE